jgi:hypothetical protein
MPKYLILAMAAGLLHAAEIKGTVVENQTGHPVARATVVVEPVAGSSAQRKSGRTDANGFFQFSGLPAGAYLVSSTRVGFAPAQYGQKQWKSAGLPLMLAENDTAAISLRLPRFGAIVGTVLDENDVGLPDHEVLAYRNTRPPQFAARAKADERGVFRISGLEPGSYLVRSAGKQYDDASYLPMFSRESETVDQAFPVEVELDQETIRVDVRPKTGRLYSLTVSVQTVPLNPTIPLPVTITLVSDLGREIVNGAYHVFTSLPAGEYEIFSQAPLENRIGFQGDYRKIAVRGDTTLTIVLHEESEAVFTFTGAPAQTANQGAPSVLARRKDLAGVGPAELLKIENNRVRLPPGPWQFALQPSPAFYAAGFSGGAPIGNPVRADGWNDSSSNGRPRFTLSGSPGSVHGIVKSRGEPVVGVPVFLESSDLEPLRRVTETSVTRTDLHGNFSFTGLAPGNYRLLSSFEYATVDSTIISRANSQSVKIEDSHDVQQDLDLYVIP